MCTLNKVGRLTKCARLIGDGNWVVLVYQPRCFGWALYGIGRDELGRTGFSTSQSVLAGPCVNREAGGKCARLIRLTCVGLSTSQVFWLGPLVNRETGEK